MILVASSSMRDHDDLLTTSQVAWMLHVTIVTVRTYCKKGLLDYTRAWPEAPYLIPKTSVEAYMNKHQLDD